MAKQKENAVVHSQEQLADGIYSMWINTEAAKDAKPGQFISMYTTDGQSGGNDVILFQVVALDAVAEILWISIEPFPVLRCTQ